MADMERGHPEELTRLLKNWLREAQDPIGTLPPGTDPEEWAVRRFISTWQEPVDGAIRSIEEVLAAALNLCHNGGDIKAIESELETALDIIRQDLREDLGLQPWHE